MAHSESYDKGLASRRDRRVNREILTSTFDDAGLVDRKLTGDQWAMAKDGKKYFDSNEYPRLMRK